MGHRGLLSIAALALLLAPGRAAAEWQIKPSVGLSFGGETTLFDPERAAGVPNVLVGVSGMLLGEVIGIEGDFAVAPGYFDAETRGSGRVLATTSERDFFASSRVTTYTANVVIALPRSLAEYTLRPYVVGGAGLIRVTIKENEDIVGGGLYGDLGSINIAAVDVGGGVTGFLTDRLGLGWDVRWFRSLKGQERGVSLGPEKLSFWRANMAVAIRY